MPKDKASEAEGRLLPHRPLGKSIATVMAFIEHGRKGEACIYATPAGKFLSPQAAINLVNTERKQAAEEMQKVVIDITTDFANKHERALMLGGWANATDFMNHLKAEVIRRGQEHLKTL